QGSSDAVESLTQISTLFAGVKTSVGQLLDSAKTLSGNLDKLAPAVKTGILQTAPTTISAMLQPVVEALQAIGKQANQPLATITPVSRGGGSELLAADVPPATSFAVSAQEARDTNITLQSITPRGEGDVVTVQGWLYRLDDPTDAGKKTLLDTAVV